MYDTDEGKILEDGADKEKENMQDWVTTLETKPSDKMNMPVYSDLTPLHNPVQSSMRIAPPGASSKTIGFAPSPSATDALARRLARSSPFASPASSKLRFRFPGPEVPLVCSLTSGAGSACVLGFRGISGIFSRVMGFCSSDGESVLMSC